MVRKRVAILISGRGSNMAALIEAAATRGFPAEIVTVIADRPDAAGLQVAGQRKIATRVVARGDFSSKDAHERALETELAECGAEIVCLAGYMRLLSAAFVSRWAGRLVNIHPSLLPLFKGLDPHRQALDAGVRVHGCSVHFVTAEADAGPIIAQAAVAVSIADTEETLAARVLRAEHQLYPHVLKLLSSGKVWLDGNTVRFADDMTRGGASRDDMLISPRATGGEPDLELLARSTP